MLNDKCQMTNFIKRIRITNHDYDEPFVEISEFIRVNS